jgi:type III pantothenate kinase
MLLAVDIGNTHTVLGLFEGGVWLHHFRIETRVGRTSDELKVLLMGLLGHESLSMGRITGGIISSVVPPATGAVERLLESVVPGRTLVVGPGIKTGMPVLYDNPKEVGADRIVNSVAAYDRFPGGSVVVDFGTATTFDVVTPRGEYLGGIIAPGLALSAEALYRATAKLPRVEIVRPARVIGKNTVASIQSGLVFGYAGMVDSLIAQIRGEIDFEPHVIATGGLGGLVARESKTIQAHDEMLTLNGLRIIHDRNQ